MHLRSNAFVIALVAGGLIASSASAATITYILDLSVGNHFILKASTSVGDNAGLVFYSVPLIGTVKSIDNKSPITVNLVNFAQAGFNTFRSADSASSIVNPTIQGSQDPINAPTANLIYGFGQEASNFAAKGITPAFSPDPTADNPWSSPLVLATGTYDRSAGTLGFNTNNGDLAGDVFATAGQRDTSAATIKKVRLSFDPPSITPINLGAITSVVVKQALSAIGDAITWGNLTTVAGIPAMAATLSPTGQFQWCTAGSQRGSTGNGVLYSWSATAANPDGVETDVAISLLLEIPEPATISLVGLAMIGMVRVIRRRG